MALELSEQVIIQCVLLPDEGPHRVVIEEAISFILVLQDIHQGRVVPSARVGAGVNPPLFAGEVSDLQLSLA